MYIPNIKNIPPIKYAQSPIYILYFPIPLFPCGSSFVKIIDNWIWMDSEDLSHKLLYPNDSNKERKEVDKDKLEEIVWNEFSCYYKKWELKTKIINWEKQKEKTEIELMVWWVIIETIETETSNNIKNFALEFPSFTYLM